jgi:hypothetical protein
MDNSGKFFLLNLHPSSRDLSNFYAIRKDENIQVLLGKHLDLVLCEFLQK